MSDPLLEQAEKTKRQILESVKTADDYTRKLAETGVAFIDALGDIGERHKASPAMLAVSIGTVIGCFPRLEQALVLAAMNHAKETTDVADHIERKDS